MMREGSDPTISSNPFILPERNHPLRASLSTEMHVRKMPHVLAPARVLQIVMLTSAQDARASLDLLSRHFAADGPPLAEDIRFLTRPFGALSFAWERHAEFMTYTFIAPGHEGELFDLAPFAPVTDWIATLPGSIIRSSHISLVRHEPSETTIHAHFAFDDLIISDAAHGKARLWSDFRLHPDGCGRLLIHDRGMTGIEASQLLQRVLELGNYRKMALLGLPEAQAATPAITALEKELTAITMQVAQADNDDGDVLEQLMALSASLAQIAASTRYRMSATRAYAEICIDRIRRLAVSPVEGYRSFDDFTERRLLPAMRSCEAFSRRIDDLSRQAAWTSGLLRTRVDTALARRNRDLLASMDRRTGLQLRLQHTVEGLSVFAISYYALNLLHHLEEALGHAGLHLPEMTDALLIPVLIFVVWRSVHHLKTKATGATGGH